MKKIIAVIIAAAMSLGLAACGQPASATTSAAETKDVAESTAKDRYTFGVSLFYRSDEYYVDIENMMKVYADKAGVDLIIQDANCDASIQMRQFEDFIQMGVDAILFSPCDPSAASSAVEAANAANIPVFTYDGVLDDPSGIASGLYSDFSADGYGGGTWAKEYIEKNLGGNAKVAILDYPKSPVVCGGRADGFQKAVEELPGVTVVARQDGQATRTGGMGVMENILTANNNDIDVVFAINYESGAGAASAMEAAGTEGIVLCVAWGKEALEKIEADDPYIKALLLGDPSDQANIVNVAKDYLDGKEVQKETYYSYYVVDHDNLNEKIDWKSIIDLR